MVEGENQSDDEDLDGDLDGECDAITQRMFAAQATALALIGEEDGTLRAELFEFSKECLVLKENVTKTLADTKSAQDSVVERLREIVGLTEDIAAAERDQEEEKEFQEILAKILQKQEEIRHETVAIQEDFAEKGSDLDQQLGAIRMDFEKQEGKKRQKQNMVGAGMKVFGVRLALSRSTSSPVEQDLVTIKFLKLINNSDRENASVTLNKKTNKVVHWSHDTKDLNMEKLAEEFSRTQDMTKFVLSARRVLKEHVRNSPIAELL